MDWLISQIVITMKHNPRDHLSLILSSCCLIIFGRAKESVYFLFQ